MTMLSQSKHLDHIHLRWGVEQVGWIGQTGAVYALDDPPRDWREPGGYSPLYQARDESCGHALNEQANDSHASHEVITYQPCAQPGCPYVVAQGGSICGRH